MRLQGSQVALVISRTVAFGTNTVQFTCNSRRWRTQHRIARHAAPSLCVREYCSTSIAVMWIVSIATGLSAAPWGGARLPYLRGIKRARQTRCHLLLGALAAIPQQKVGSMSVLTHCALRPHQHHRQQCGRLLRHQHHGQRMPPHHHRHLGPLLHPRRAKTRPSRA